MQRLAALVPRPRLHLIRFHGVLAPNARLRPEIIPGGPVNANNTAAEHGDAPPPSAPTRMSWAWLLKRVFDIHIEQCPRCGGTLKIIAIGHPPVIVKILTHLGLPARAPPGAAIPSTRSSVRSISPEPTIPLGLYPPQTPTRPET